MKTECVKEKLKIAVGLIDKISAKNINIPIIQSIVILVKNKSIILKATNLEIGVEYTIPAKVTTEGVCSVPSNIFSQVISGLYDSDIVSLEIIKDNLLISTKNTSTFIKTTDYKEFPLIPRIIDGVSLEIPSQKIVDGIRSVWYAASVSDIKPEISSVYIYPDDNNILFVATDSFRLAEKKIQIKDTPTFNGILLPFKNINDIIRILESSKDNLVVIFNKNQISFTTNEFYLTSRIIDGIFPDYRQIIPKEHKTEIILLKKDFVNSIKTTTVFSDTFNQIRIIIDVEQKTVYFESKNTNTGEATSHIKAVVSGESITTNFNYKYLIDSLQSISDDSIIFHFNGINKPLVIKGGSDKSFLYLAMPMNR